MLHLCLWVRESLIFRLFALPPLYPPSPRAVGHQVRVRDGKIREPAATQEKRSQRKFPHLAAALMNSRIIPDRKATLSILSVLSRNLSLILPIRSRAALLRPKSFNVGSP